MELNLWKYVFIHICHGQLLATPVSLSIRIYLDTDVEGIVAATISGCGHDSCLIQERRVGGEFRVSCG